MTTSAIVKFTVQPGKAGQLMETLGGGQAAAVAAGAHSITLCQSESDPNVILELEVWDSSADHQAFVSNMPAEAMEAISACLTGPPEVTYATMHKSTSK